VKSVSSVCRVQKVGQLWSQTIRGQMPNLVLGALASDLTSVGQLPHLSYGGYRGAPVGLAPACLSPSPEIS
jgi:hypothetical protein